MKSLSFIAFAGLLLVPIFSASAQPAAPAPQLTINGDQWVIQVPPNSPVPQNIVLQLGSPSAAPAPGVVIQQPPMAPVAAAVLSAPTEVYVTEAPPAPPVEVIPAAPDHYHVWLAGHYEWTHHGYVWRVGRWERPPHHGARWTPARYEFRGGRCFYVEGRWDR